MPERGVMNTFTNEMELLYGLIRKQAWTAFHPPPLIYNGHNQYSKSFKDPPKGSH